MITRLDSVDPSLVEDLLLADSDGLRRVAVAVAEPAVRRTGLIDRRVDTARLAALEGRFGQSNEQAESLVDELDQTQWALQDEAEAGMAPAEAHLSAFQRARAAGAWVFVLDSDPQRAAFEATYEAIAAIDDLDAVRRLVRGVLPDG